jgi:hypothetical protein
MKSTSHEALKRKSDRLAETENRNAATKTTAMLATRSRARNLDRSDAAEITGG